MMNRTNKNIKFSLITFTYFFFIALQFLRFNSLEISYLGEKITFSLTPLYCLIALLIPVVLFVFLYIPLLFVVTVDIHFNIGFGQFYFRFINNIHKPKTRSFYQKNLFSKYQVIRC